MTPNKPLYIDFSVCSGPLLILNACWSKAKADLYWVVGCQGSGDAVIIAYGDSDEELFEGLQVGLPDLDGDPLTCVAGFSESLFERLVEDDCGMPSVNGEMCSVGRFHRPVRSSRSSSKVA